MDGVTIRDLRNRSAEVLRRVEHGETLTVTRDGEPVAAVALSRDLPVYTANPNDFEGIDGLAVHEVRRQGEA